MERKILVFGQDLELLPGCVKSAMQECLGGRKSSGISHVCQSFPYSGHDLIVEFKEVNTGYYCSRQYRLTTGTWY